MTAAMTWISGWAFPDLAWQPVREALEKQGFRGARLPMIGSWSLGAFQALEMAVAASAPECALVLIGATPRFCATSDYTAGQPEAALRAMQRQFERDPKATLENFHQRCAAPHPLPAAELEQRTAQSLALHHDVLSAGLRRLREMDLRTALVHVRWPTLILHGDADQVVPVAAAYYLAEQLPHARMAVLPGAGHDLPLRHAEWIAGKIMRFAETLA